MRKVWLRRAIALVALGVVAAAALLQFASYSSLTWLNALALRPFPGRIGFWRLLFVLTAMAFITSAVPSGGA